MLRELNENGYCIIPEVFGESDISAMREIVTANIDKMGNTRPNKASRHLAGFHRYPALESLHNIITSNALLSTSLETVFEPTGYISIGLSDITINRSQPWHTDLLRGKYARYLTPEDCWSNKAGRCIKALLYLQDGKSLKVLPGSHLQPLPLTNDHSCVPESTVPITEVKVRAGEVVLMDIRLVHRGSTEEEMQNLSLTDGAKILVSTVLGSQRAPLTSAMQIGNAHRMADWDAKNLVPA